MDGVSIGSDNGSSLIRRKPLSKPLLVCLLSIGSLGLNFSEIYIKVQHFLYTKMHLKISSAKWWSFCRGWDGLKCVQQHSGFMQYHLYLSFEHLTFFLVCYISVGVTLLLLWIVILHTSDIVWYTTNCYCLPTHTSCPHGTVLHINLRWCSDILCSQDMLYAIQNSGSISNYILPPETIAIWWNVT